MLCIIKLAPVEHDRIAIISCANGIIISYNKYVIATSTRLSACEFLCVTHF